MTARKKAAAPAEQTPVTVAELLLALASYPQDAIVELSDPYAMLTALVEGDPVDAFHVLWEPAATTSIVEQRPQHYRRPDIVERVIRRSEPMDDFAAAREFLEWLEAQGYEPPRQSTGGGHNEPTSYRDFPALELAQEFAERPNP